MGEHPEKQKHEGGMSSQSGLACLVFLIVDSKTA